MQTKLKTEITAAAWRTIQDEPHERLLATQCNHRTFAGFVATLPVMGIPLCCSPDCEGEEERDGRFGGVPKELGRRRQAPISILCSAVCPC